MWRSCYSDKQGGVSSYPGHPNREAALAEATLNARSRRIVRSWIVSPDEVVEWIK